MELEKVVEFLDEILEIEKFPEDEGNSGLQVKGKDEVKKIGLAVDACQYVFQKAAEKGMDFLFVHHGLIWGSLKSIDEVMAQRLKKLICNDISLYACHLALDLSPKYGNNAQLIKVLGIERKGEFGRYHGKEIGYWGELKNATSLKDFAKAVEEALQAKCHLLDHGKEVKRIGVVSGRGGFSLSEAPRIKIDTLLTGEASHAAYLYAEETCTNIVFAGHYATETLGVKAVGEELKNRLNIETEFIDHPTGL
jgi:dinuclear metal center YbgI/SA1388 family protein